MCTIVSYIYTRESQMISEVESFTSDMVLMVLLLIRDSRVKTMRKGHMFLST